MTPTKMAGQFGDTTYTKVFVGGLAWETQTETMKKYFDQFGEILEAVVITDKNSGRSKGYGFVTFREPEAATRACVDASPVIDGRRANCNLASLGVYKSKPTIPQHLGGRSLRMTKSFNSGVQGGGGAAFPSPASLPYYAVQQYVYGYSPYSAEYAYPASYYNMYGGAAAPYPVYGAGAGVVSGAATSFYPYVQLGQGSYSVPLPSLVQYSGVASTSGFTGFRHPFGGTISIPPSTPSQTGLTMGLTSPSLPSPTPHHHTIIPPQSVQSTASEQPLA